MNTEFLSRLQCPISGAPLEPLSEAERSGVQQGRLRHANGSPATLDLQEGVATPDGRYVYPVVDGIFVLLPSLVLVRVDLRAPITEEETALAAETNAVMRFYNEIGWQRSAGGVFTDAERYEDLRPVSADYIRRCHLRVKQCLAPRGQFLLDVASGPIQYPEYLRYSEGYNQRVCADISLAALRAAREKLGDRGVYVQCDITRLPFRDGSMDGIVSLHTIYHVPAERQALAFRELARVLAPGRTGVVVYTWGNHCKSMQVLTWRPHPVAQTKVLARRWLPKRFIRFLKQALGRSTAADSGSASSGGARLYFSPHSYRWVRRELNAQKDCRWTMRVWRSVSVPFLKRYVHGTMGQRFLSALFWFEERAPWLMGRFGQYPLLVCEKAAEPADQRRDGSAGSGG